MRIFRDFVSEERKEYGFKMGTHLASALSGFVAGALVASIIWGVAVYFHLLAI